MKLLRCDGLDCPILTDWAKLANAVELEWGFCLCAESLRTMKNPHLSRPLKSVKVESEADLDALEPLRPVGA